VPDKIITALFDSRSDAEGALRQLSQAGIGQERVQIASESGEGATGGVGRTGNLATVLNDQSLPPSDRETFAEGLRRGGYLLTVRADDVAATQVVSILDETDAVDLDERAEQWRSSGWAGPQVQTNMQPRGESLAAQRPELSQNLGQNLGQNMGQTHSSSQGESIPVVEEQLKVGKREIQRGGVRVRSFVVETPVHEEVTLREEHVSIERRPVNDPTRAGDELMQERTIEFTETAEEAVVAKEARVVEEVVVRKDVEQRIETIDDTVRHTDVEIEDNRGRPLR
jgi:uncharacterized protein (TIGR02271 family)